jgi:hypothetical protein
MSWAWRVLVASYNCRLYAVEKPPDKLHDDLGQIVDLLLQRVDLIALDVSLRIVARTVAAVLQTLGEVFHLLVVHALTHRRASLVRQPRMGCFLSVRTPVDPPSAP